jgi:hypothetical protein
MGTGNFGNWFREHSLWVSKDFRLDLSGNFKESMANT